MVLENKYTLESFDPQVLREYDIRGIVGKNLNENTAYTIGRTFGYIVKSKTSSGSVVTGFDGRLTSPILHLALCQGLKESGIQVIDIGMGPTPMIYFAHYHFNSDAAVMVTGSHNPKDYNGFKMVFQKHSFFAQDIQDLKKLVNSDLEVLKGTIVKHDITDDYANRCLKNIKIKNEMKIAWDIANGAMGEIIDKVVSKLPNTENIIINKDVDGNFPSHHPDPTIPENMQQLIKTVLDNKCDLGLAFDGDGDRLGVVDNQGRIIWADQYMLILSKEIAELYTNPKIIMDIKCSKVLFDELKKMNCEPIIYRTGHSHIKEKMKKVDSPFSGEMSGHVCYGDDFYGYDDAMYVALRLLRVLGNQDKSLNEIILEYPKTYSTPEIRIDVKEDRKFKIIDEIKKRLSDHKGDIIDIDGIRIQNDLGWFLIRASNTQNQLTCRAESTKKENLLSLIGLIEEQLLLSDINFKFNA